MPGLLARLRLPSQRGGPYPTSAPSASRRKSARAAVWSGVAAFAVLTMGMAAALDTVKPEWRDPEFALRLRQIQQWRELSPGRPLVVAFGSSRTQMGLSPAAMGFGDSPGSPLVYNLGYRSGRPVGVWLHFQRLLDEGVRPDAVLFQLAPGELMGSAGAEKQLLPWAPRLSPGDVRRLAPVTNDPESFRRSWYATRLSPFTTYRAAVLSEYLPDWQPSVQRLALEWERMDEYGFSPSPITSVPSRARRANEDLAMRQLGRVLRAFRPSPISEDVYRRLVSKCRSEGIAYAFFWAPAAPVQRGFSTPESRTAIAELSRRLAAEHGAPVFPEPTDLTDEDFLDGDHLTRDGAVKYSRWLAETHLKPWFVSQGLSK